jgi:hypothetical protein
MSFSGGFRCRVCGKPVRLRLDEMAGSHRGKNGHPCPGSGFPDAGAPPCLPTCNPAGTIGWPLEPQRDEAHLSTVVCDSPSHQRQASAWVEAGTGHAGVFRPFERSTS